MFALDVFGQNLGSWKTLLTLTMHLIPSLLLTGALAMAWRWEWIGAVIYTAAGAFARQFETDTPVAEHVALAKAWQPAAPSSPTAAVERPRANPARG